MIRAQALAMLAELRQHRLRREIVEHNAPWYRAYYKQRGQVTRAQVEKALERIVGREDCGLKECGRLRPLIEESLARGWESADGFVPPRWGRGLDDTARRYWEHRGDPPADAEPEEVEIPRDGIFRGHHTRIHVPGENPLSAQYAVLELKRAVPSHDFSKGAPPTSNVERGRYPEGLQPRIYSADSAEAQAVIAHASPKQRHPDFFVSTHPSADSGPPTLSRDLKVINGNSRAMSLQYAWYRKDYAWYRDRLRETAPIFGIRRAAVDAYKAPLLVRIVDMAADSAEARRFAGQGNVSLMQAQSPARLGASLNRMVTDELLQSLALSEDATFSEVVTDASRGKTFRRHLYESLPEGQRATYFREDQTLTESGIELVRSILLTKVVPVELVEHMGEERRQLKRTLDAALPQIIMARRDDPDRDLSPQLVEALGFMLRNPEVKTSGQADDVLGQLAIWGGRAERISPGGRMMLDALLEYGDRARVLRDKLKRFLGDSNLSGGLFGGEVPPIEQIASEAFGVQLRDGAQFGGEMPRIDDLLRGPDNSTVRLSAAPSKTGDTLHIRIV